MRYSHEMDRIDKSVRLGGSMPREQYYDRYGNPYESTCEGDGPIYNHNGTCVGYSDNGTYYDNYGNRLYCSYTDY